MGFGAPELIIVLLIVLVLFGYKKLPDASRALGRSLRIFKGEMKGMKDDDSAAGGLRGKDAAHTTPVRGEIVPSTAPSASDLLADEARLAEERAAELRARADQARASDRPR